MTNEYTIRPATLADKDFLVEASIAAEKSGTDILSYTTVFGLTEDETQRYIGEMLEEEVDGCELSVSGFLVAEKDGQPAAAICAWIEGEEGVSSSTMKGNLLNFVLPHEAIKKAASVYQVIADLSIDYIPGQLCIGLVYVAPGHRGKNLFGALLQAHHDETRKTHPEFDMYVQVFESNIAAIKAYSKAGFKEVSSRVSSKPEILELLPSNKKTLMKKRGL